MAYSAEYTRNNDSGEGRNNVRKWVGIIWYFVIGSETIYHIFKGLYLTWIFSIKIPMEKVLSRVGELGPQVDTDMVGMTLFSLQEWQYHFVFGLRGPMVLFGAYLLYRYTLYLSPFRKSNDSGKPRKHHRTSSKPALGVNLSRGSNGHSNAGSRRGGSSTSSRGRS